MLNPVLVIALREEYGFRYFQSILITSAIPSLVQVAIIPLWARLLDRAHVVKFRSIHSWVFVLGAAAMAAAPGGTTPVATRTGPTQLTLSSLGPAQQLASSVVSPGTATYDLQSIADVSSADSFLASNLATAYNLFLQGGSPTLGAPSLLAAASLAAGSTSGSFGDLNGDGRLDYFSPNPDQAVLYDAYGKPWQVWAARAAGAASSPSKSRPRAALSWPRAAVRDSKLGPSGWATRSRPGGSCSTARSPSRSWPGAPRWRPARSTICPALRETWAPSWPSGPAGSGCDPTRRRPRRPVGNSGCGCGLMGKGTWPRLPAMPRSPSKRRAD
jgi:hypothetical protein